MLLRTNPVQNGAHVSINCQTTKFKYKVNCIHVPKAVRPTKTALKRESLSSSIYIASIRYSCQFPPGRVIGGSKQLHKDTLGAPVIVKLIKGS